MSAPYQEGIEAFVQGLAQGENPYIYEYQDREFWEFGWEYAKLTAERDALLKDKARLDHLSKSTSWFDVPSDGNWTPESWRAAIDADMTKEVGK